MSDMDKKITVLVGRHERVINELTKRNINCVVLCDNDDIDYSVRNHADMSAFKLSDGRILLDRRQIKAGEYLSEHGTGVIYTAESISGEYPFDVRLNAARAGKSIICNKKYISPEILRDVENIIDVRQGYTKCSVLAACENALITDDTGIFKRCMELYDILMIEKGDIFLPGKSYGFIGGASGKIGDKVYFFGNLDSHRDGDKIKAFLDFHCVPFECLFDGVLTDIGGIIEI